MSAISLKSITGITSITAPAGVDNQLTLHTNNTTERLKIDVAGNVHVNNHLAVAGVTTFINNVKFDGATAGRDVTFIRSSNTLEFATNAILELGNGGSGDCRLFNNGTDTRIINGDGTLKFESDTHEFKDKDNTTSYLNIKSDGKVLIANTLGLGGATSNPGELLHAQTVSGEGKIVVMGATTGTVAISGLNGASRVLFGDSSTENAGNITYTHSSDTLSFRINGNTRWKFDSSGHFLPDSVGSYNIGSATAEIGDIFIADNKKVFLGSDQDFTLHHNNSHAIVKNTTGRLYVLSDDLWFKNQADNSNLARFINADSVLLYYAGNPKLQTLSTGISVTGKVVASGEIEASQDYPNQRPSLDLNFAATKKLDSRITYTRSGRASFINEHGLLEIVNSNVPRFDHYPVTRECKGLLIEEARTNYVIYSKMLEGWSYGVGSDVFSASSGSQLSTNPDGSSPAYHYVPSSSAGHHRYNETVTVPTLNTNYVVSVFVKRVTVGSVSNLNRYVELEVTGNFNANSAGSGQSGSNGGSHVVYDLQDLTVHPGQSDNERGYVGDAKLKAYPNDWYRLSYVFNPGSGSQFTGTIWWGHPSANTGDSGNEQGNNNPSFYFWGASVEQGSFLTSYIPTYGSTATRGGDRTYIAINDGLDFYNPVESTILVDYTHQDGVTSSNLGTNARLYRFRATGGADTRIDYVTNTGYNPYIAKDGVSPANLSHGQQTVFGGGLNRNAVRVKENSFAVSFNGSTVVEDTSGAWNPTNAIDHVTLGGFNDSFSGQLSGHIQRFTYYPVGLPNSQLVTLTS